MLTLFQTAVAGGLWFYRDVDKAGDFDANCCTPKGGFPASRGNRFRDWLLFANTYGRGVVVLMSGLCRKLRGNARDLHGVDRHDHAPEDVVSVTFGVSFSVPLIICVAVHLGVCLVSISSYVRKRGSFCCRGKRLSQESGQH